MGIGATRTFIGFALLTALALGAAPASSFGQNPDYQLSMPDACTGESIGSSVTLTADFEVLGASATGFQYGVCHDNSVLTIENADSAPGVEALDTTFTAVVVQGNDGYTCGVLMNVIASVVVDGLVDDVTTATYTVAAPFESTSVDFCGTLGVPIVELAAVVNGEPIAPETTSATITVCQITSFIRSDCNDDSANDIADGIFVLQYLFQNGPDPSCVAACDFNGDGIVDTADPVGIFEYQFLDGPAPAAPFPNCGVDETIDPEDCAAQSSCE